MSDQRFPLGTGVLSSPDPDAVQAAVTAITARDPAFNLDAFLAEAQQAFWLVGQAHEQCKPELCQSVLSPTLAERETASIQEDCQEGTVRAPRDEDASSGQLVSIQSDANRDTATVHFTSTWKSKSRKGPKDERRTENWCFQRLATERTVLGGEGERCHNCGASLTSSAGRCRYCGTLISADAGWRVIRVDEVSAQEAAQTASAMREIIAGIAAFRAATTTTPTEAPAPAPRRRRHITFTGILRMVFFAAIAAAALVIAAMSSSGTLHRRVAQVIPAIRYPILEGPADLSGRVTAQHVTLTQVVPKFHTGGTCAKEALRTAWEFKGKLPDGSAFHLEVGLPPAAGGPGTYHRPAVTMRANAQNQSSFIGWSANAATAATLVVRPDGGGDLQFANLAPDSAGTGAPLSGHLAWSCNLG